MKRIILAVAVAALIFSSVATAKAGQVVHVSRTVHKTEVVKRPVVKKEVVHKVEAVHKVTVHRR